MNKYKFDFGYIAIKMLGKTLYSNPFAALSELVANGLDASANKVWIYIDIRDKKKSKIEVIDNGLGMSEEDILKKYLKVGKLNRAFDNKTMMGRKGIGKLAAFYLSNNYFIKTKTIKENNIYSVDFRNCELDENNEEYMHKVSSLTLLNENIFDQNNTGTCIQLNDVNLSGYGEKAFEAFPYNLSEYFSFDDDSKCIFLKLVVNDDDINNDYIRVLKKTAFKNMTKIYYFSDDNEYESIKNLNGEKILQAEKKDKEENILIVTEKYDKYPASSEVDGKAIQLKPYGWIGIHQTINRKLAILNDPDNFIDSRYYNFNKVRIYVRKKLALENILPLVHNTQYYVNYIEGEIHCDELDDNNLPDIASSSRQDLDKNDDRVVKLIEYVGSLVRILVNYKIEQSRVDDSLYAKRQTQAITRITNDMEKTLNQFKDRSISSGEIQNIKHSILNSFKSVSDSAKTDYKLFFSHKRCDKKYSDFFYHFLIDVKGFSKDMIFYTSCDGGVDESIQSLEKQINDTLTSINSYACFFVLSDEFKRSEFCMFEGGAAWAVKQNNIIGLLYRNYEDIPKYLSNMKNIKAFLSNDKLERDTYLQLVNVMNSMIEYLNNNYINENQKKSLIDFSNLPNDVELKKNDKTVYDYFDEDIIEYWRSYVIKK